MPCWRSTPSCSGFTGRSAGTSSTTKPSRGGAVRSSSAEAKWSTNFDRTLPAAQSDLARESLKDPYKLDFLGLHADAREREIEQALVDHVADFLLELGEQRLIAAGYDSCLMKERLCRERRGQQG